MKRSTLMLIGLGVAAVAGVGFAYLRLGTEAGVEADHVHTDADLVYACPMHPQVRSASPGKCPICGMELVKLMPTVTKGAMPMGTKAKTIVPLSPSQVATLGVATVEVAPRPMKRTMRVTGRIDDDETTHRVVSSRVRGRVEKLNVNFVGRPVTKGAALATLYSPDVLTAERVYLERLKVGPISFAPADLAAAKERLLELGLTGDEITELENSKEPSALVALRTPADGTVVSRYVYEGQYVEAGDKLFEIGDFTKMWFMFDAYEQDLPWLAVGQTVEVTSDALAGEKLVETINFIDPNVDMTTRTNKVRVVLNDPHVALGDIHIYLPHGVLATGVVQLGSPIMLTIPKSAVINTGSGPIAYVDIGGNAYERRELQLGRKGDDLIEVVDGVVSGEKVVANAALLIDAQAQISAPAGMDMP